MIILKRIFDAYISLSKYLFSFARPKPYKAVESDWDTVQRDIQEVQDKLQKEIDRTPEDWDALQAP